MATRKNKTKTKTMDPRAMTVFEFKSWLLGILEFQEDGWVPNLEQWKTIKSIVENLKETATVVVNQEQNEFYRTNLQPREQIGDMVTHSTTGIGESRPVHVSELRKEELILNPAARPVIQKTGNPTQTIDPVTGKTITSTGTMVKTASVDTSDGNYTSGFE